MDMTARPTRKTEIWIKPTTMLRSQPNKEGRAPTRKINNPTNVTNRPKRILLNLLVGKPILFVSFDLEEGLIIPADSPADGATSSPAGSHQHPGLNNRVTPGYQPGWQDLRYYPDQQELIPIQNLHQNRYPDRHGWSHQPSGKYGLCGWLKVDPCSNPGDRLFFSSHV